MKSLTPIILIIISVATYYVYISPAFSGVQTLRQEKARFDEVLLKSKEIKDMRDTIMTTYNALPPQDIEKLKKVVPENFTAVNLANYINNISSKYGFVPKSMKITQPNADDRTDLNLAQEAKPFKTVNASFSIKGSYEQFTTFLKDLETGIYLVDVTGVSVKSESKEKGPLSVYDFSIDIMTYSIN